MIPPADPVLAKAIEAAHDLLVYLHTNIQAGDAGEIELIATDAAWPVIEGLLQAASDAVGQAMVQMHATDPRLIVDASRVAH